MRPDARLPRIAATFLEEDSNGWLVTFSDLVLQLFAFVMVAAVLGTTSVTSLSVPATSTARADRPSAPSSRAPAEIPAPPTADALSLARFDDLPPRAAGSTRNESVVSIPAAPPAEAVEVNPEPVMAAKGADAPVPARSLATELESFVVAEGLEDVVQVAVNGGGVTLSISDTIGFA